jgi:hypothetical protein
MNILGTAARVHRAALITAFFGITQLAHAETIELVGLFEGHGIAPADDPVTRRRAAVAAQRLSLLCQQYYQVRGGGTGAENTECRDGELELKRIGPASAAAILDVLDEPRVQGYERCEPLAALIRALSNTGRADLVPVLLKALERLDAREHLSDQRVQAFGRNHVDSLLQALSTLTYVTSLDLYAINRSRGYSDAPTAYDFATWYAAHAKESRAEWRKQAIERTQALLKDSKPEAFSAAQCRLVAFTETKVAAVARLKAYVRRPECANWACSDERYTLQSVEPWGHWTPPEWQP